jgi:serine/threonine-protein phosphatase 6 regulatory subunit 3
MPCTSAKPKGVRLGYMGHLTLISEDVLIALERFPPELRLVLIQYAPDPEWDEYVTGRYNETKKRDTCLLGGGKPVVALGANRNNALWKVDEEDTRSPLGNDSEGNRRAGETRGEFRRAGSVRPSRESSADFGPTPMEDIDDDEDDDSAPHVRINITSVSHYGDLDLFILSSRVIWPRRCIRRTILDLLDLMMMTRMVDGCHNRLSP